MSSGSRYTSPLRPFVHPATGEPFLPRHTFITEVAGGQGCGGAGKCAELIGVTEKLLSRLTLPSHPVRSICRLGLSA